MRAAHWHKTVNVAQDAPHECARWIAKRMIWLARHTAPELREWMAEYAHRRYGVTQQGEGNSAVAANVGAAWRLLADSVYSCVDGVVDHVRIY